MSESIVIEALDRAKAAGRVVDFWLRDDDAVMPSEQLDVYLELVERHDVPVTFAVIPESSGAGLAARLKGSGHRVAVHGWSHRNHEAAGVKKAELGRARPAPEVLAELQRGHQKLKSLYLDDCLDLLVPPWNRIAPEVALGLKDIGFRALSVFGPEASEMQINTHIDPIDWHGSRSLVSGNAPWQAAGARIDAVLNARGGMVGLLTHHLVHDAAIAGFVERFLAATCTHPACRWVTPDQVMPALTTASM